MMPAERETAFLSTDPSGRHVRFPGAIAFGTSMLPFFRPQGEVWYAPVEPSAIRTGDVITVRLGLHRLITHRVVKVTSDNGSPTFLTKGDNALLWDSPVFAHQILGKVTRVDQRDLTQPLWRQLGRLIAWFSYGQGVMYLCLKESGWNRWRHLLERKGLFPRVRLLSLYQRLSPPLGWIKAAGGLQESFCTLRERRRFSKEGVQINAWTADDVGPMTQVWNEAFPNFRTSPDRLQRFVCQSPWFDPSGCFLVKKGGRLIGWAYASLRPDGAQRNTQEASTGFIEVVALGKENRNASIGKALIQELLRWFRGKGISRISLGPLPVRSLPYGFSLEPALDAAAACGFQPTSVFTELVLARSKFHREHLARSIQGVSLRDWQPNDDTVFPEFLRAYGYPFVSSMYQSYRARGGKGGILVASLENKRLVGICRWLLDSELNDYSDLTWPWSVARHEGPRAYVFGLVVDRAWRGGQLGHLLAAWTLERALEAGAQEILIWAAKTAFYRRLGFVSGHQFLSMWRSLDAA